MQSLLQTISKPFTRGTSQQEQPLAGCEGRLDQEEDGFLLVGDTASDRTAVHASTFQADRVDAPPQYGQVAQNSLPTYKELTQASRNYQSPSLDTSQHPDLTRSVLHEESHVNPTSSVITDPSLNVTALTGVPFQLGSGLASRFILSDIRNSGALRDRHLNLDLYEYDFNLEQSFLREHGTYNNQCEVMDYAY